MIPFSSSSGQPDANINFEINVLKKLKASTKVGARATPIRIVGPYADGIVETINRLNKFGDYAKNVDIVAAQAFGDSNFNRKKLGQLSKLATDANRTAGVSGINDWEVVAKNQNMFKGPKDAQGKDKPEKVKRDPNMMKKDPAGKAKFKNNPPVTEALATGFGMYIAGSVVPRFVSPTGVATDAFKLWSTGNTTANVTREYIIDKDNNTRTYFIADGKIKGYDKKALWSARATPDQERLEDPCPMSSGSVSLEPYLSCQLPVANSTAPVPPPMPPQNGTLPVNGTNATDPAKPKRILATTETAVGSTVTVKTIPDCVAVFLESCCTSTNACTATPILTPGTTTIADTTCANTLVMEEICGQDSTVKLNSVQQFAGIASVAAMLAVLAF